MTSYNSKWRFRNKCPLLFVFPNVLLYCAACSVPALWNISNELSLFIYLLSQSYSKWQRLVMWPTAKWLGLDFQVLSTLCSTTAFYTLSKKNPKRVWSMNNSLICVWRKVVLSGKILRKWLENKFGGLSWRERFAMKTELFVELYTFPMDSLVSAGEITR